MKSTVKTIQLFQKIEHRVFIKIIHDLSIKYIAMQIKQNPNKNRKWYIKIVMLIKQCLAGGGETTHKCASQDAEAGGSFGSKFLRVQ